MATTGDLLYHETSHALSKSEIKYDGLKPTSYGQSLVTDDGSVISPEEMRERIREELEANLEDEDADVTDDDVEA
jgi:hypothetical protein